MTDHNHNITGEKNSPKKPSGYAYRESAASRTIRQALQLSFIDVAVQNPLDVFSRLALAEGHECRRLAENEMVISLPGHWSNYAATLCWKPAEAILQIYIAYDFHVPEGWEAKMYDLVGQLNSRLTVGHFDYWASDAAIVYRQSMCLSGEARLNTAQAMTMLAAALEASEKAYPAMQYMLWADKSVNDAIDQSLLEAATRAL